MKRLLLLDLRNGFVVFLIIPVHIIEIFFNVPGSETAFGKNSFVLYYSMADNRKFSHCHLPNPNTKKLSVLDC